MATLLTQGSIFQLYDDKKPKNPVVQIMNLKHAVSQDPTAPKRVKALISDGEYSGAAVLTSDMAALVANDAVKANYCVKLKTYMVNMLANTKLCIIMDLEVVSEAEEQIGEPVDWTQRVKAEPVAAEVVEETTSPAAKGPAKNLTPSTSNVSSRVTSNYAPTPAAPPVMNSSRAMPISALNPYSNKWLIKARVTTKSELKTFDKGNGVTSVFDMTLCDESGEIRATVWREAADKYFNAVEVGSVYLVARGNLKLANRKFSTVNNAYEMHLGLETSIQLCEDEASMVPKIHYAFVPIADIEAKPVNATIDVVGVVSGISETSKITSKRTGADLVKRMMHVADDSGKSIELTLWGGTAERFPMEEGAVVAFKGLRVTEWNTKSLNSGRDCSFEVNPDIDATARLQAWASEGGASAVTTISVNERGAGGGRVDTWSTLGVTTGPALRIPRPRAIACSTRLTPRRSGRRTWRSRRAASSPRRKSWSCSAAERAS
jgi:replication factor A1